MTADHRIPRRLFQFWHDRGAMPEYYRQAIERTRAMHPGYEHVLADDAMMAELVRQTLGRRALEVYETTSVPASRADLARCVLLHAHGGYYLDGRLGLQAPLHELVPADTELLLGWALGSPCNGILGAIPRHPFFETMLAQALRNLERGYFRRDVATATGPACMQSVLDHHGPYRRSRRVDVLAVATSEMGRAVRDRGYEHWIHAQARGIRPASSFAAPALPRDDDDAVLVEERAYLASRPARGTMHSEMPEPFQSALNHAMTGDAASSWRDDLARRGPFPDVAMLSLAHSPDDLELVHRAGAKRLSVYSPRASVLARIEADVAWRGWPLQLELVRQDLPHLELPARAFDLVISHLTLHRAPDPGATIAQIARALRPGGCLGFFEYVGEDRFQFSARRLALADALLDRVASAVGDRARPAVVSPLAYEFGPFGAARSSRILAEAGAVLEERHRATWLVAAVPAALMYGEAGVWLMLASDGDAAARVLAYEESIRGAGEDGVLAYAVYQKRPETDRGERSDVP